MAVPRKRENNYIHKKKREKKKESRGGSKWLHSEWWRQRSKYIRMSRPVCEMCEEVEMTNPSEEVDHIEPVPTNPDVSWSEFVRLSREDNLQALCKRHHAWKTANDKKR